MFLFIITIVLFILLLIAAEIDGGGPFMFIGSLITYLWVGNFLEPVWYFTTNNVVGVIIGLCSYIIIGSVWSFFKWYKYVQQLVNEHKHWFDNGKLLEKYKDDFDDITNLRYRTDKIATWIFCWPTSFILYFIGDFVFNFVKNVTNFIVKRFNQVYQKITDSFIK